MVSKYLVGAWLGDDSEVNEQEIEGLIALSKAGFVDVAAVGNEVMYRGDLEEDELITFINRVKNEIPNIPVGYVDAYYEFSDRPKITEVCDVILASVTPIGRVVVGVLFGIYETNVSTSTKCRQRKKVIITEGSGWPKMRTSLEGAHPSYDNALVFINAQKWSKDDAIEMFYFSSFDESWKVGSEGDVGAYWGLWDKDEKKFKILVLHNISIMNYIKVLGIQMGLQYAIQDIVEDNMSHVYPTYDEVKEDLLIIEKQWQYIRLYSCDKHSKSSFRSY